ncbi:hypothetical protein BRC86_12290 [Halobacteriales archaeon QS_3_64_16]|nr:MAG: hypothetical protein BRC86_12290 [Halobacteriales archaeon QS_3_64_16]
MDDIVEADIGKPIFTAEEQQIGTLREINGPTIYIELIENIDKELRSDITVAERTGIKYDGKPLAGAARASIETVTDGEIYFWPAYATETRHASVSYDEIPGEDSNVELDET